MSKCRFDAMSNPYGVIFHPIPLIRGLNRALDGSGYEDKELCTANSEYVSFDFHGKFRQDDKNSLLSSMNGAQEFLQESLLGADLLILTFGTARAYVHKSSGQVVSNCHKMPQQDFDKQMFSAEEIVTEVSPFLAKLRSLNSKIKIIMTVSPVRHWKDGAIENGISKSHLRIAVNELCKGDHTFYFPAYEIMMDELRDYRFYAEDMLHPSPLSVSYIWRKFQESSMTEGLTRTVQEIERISRIFDHHGFVPQSKLDESESRIEDLIQRSKIKT